MASKDNTFDVLGQSMPELNRRIYLALSRTYLTKLIENTPVKTGETAGEWEIDNPGDLIFEFVNDRGSIVGALEFGMQPMIIKAKKKFMKFKKPTERKSPYQKIPGNIAFEKDGYIYAKMIRHPGFAARHFIRDTFNDTELANAFVKELLSMS